MDLILLKRTTIIWLGLFALGFVSGALREVGIKRFIADPLAHHLSALTGVLIFGAYVYGVWVRIGIATRREATITGVYWFLLTVLAETFILNRWISKLTWKQILDTYDITRGELWPLVLIWVGVLPIVIRALRSPEPT